MEKEESLKAKYSLHWAHWLVLIFSLMITIFAWYFSSKQISLKVESQFNKESEQVIHLVLERMSKYEDALWAGVATINSYNDKITFSRWNRYVSSLNLLNKYPGINGLGVIEKVLPSELSQHYIFHQKERPKYSIHPKHSYHTLFPIVHILPLASNKKAVGLDVAHEQNRLNALLRARDTGLATMTAPIFLVQDQEKTPGFLFYTPFYKGDNHQTQALRRDNFMGLVYAPFIVKKLMSGVLHQNQRAVSIKITDGDVVLYNELTQKNKNFIKADKFIKEETLFIYGRHWKFTVKGGNFFREASQSSQPLTILIDSLLLFLFLSIASANKKATNYALLVTKDLKKKTELLEKSNQYKSEFLSNMSHELRTPLNSVILLSKLLREDTDKNFDAETLKMLGYINKGGHNLLLLVNDILDLAKIEAGKMQVCNSKMNLNVFLKTIEEEFLMSCKEKSLKLAVKLHEHLPKTITTDQRRVLQIIRNFMSNALKFTESGSITVTVSLLDIKSTETLFSPGESVLAFCVTDTGIGLDKIQQQEIFEAFKQIDGSLNRKYSGTGLGLTISNNLAKLLGGKIIVESVLGNGASFTFCLPFSDHTFRNDADNGVLLDKNNRDLGSKSKPSFLYVVHESADLSEMHSLTNLVEFSHDKNNVTDLIKSRDYDCIIIEKRSFDINLFSDILLLCSNEKKDKTALFVIERHPLQMPAVNIDAVVSYQLILSNNTLAELIPKIKSWFLGLEEFHSNKSKIISQFKGKKVLVVDDDRLNIIVLERVLFHTGITIISAIDGENALKALCEIEDIDIVLLDMMMPKLNGYNVMKIIREQEELKYIPIIAVTAKAMQEDRNRCLDLGANEYVSKPIDDKSLIEVMAFYLSLK